ncbi:MAG TPA: Spy/CpxP family protein refolding chaperone [Gemmatimonadales bacterium]
MTARYLLTLLALVAAPLAAQQPVKPDTAKPGMMGPGMMGRGRMMGQGMQHEMMAHMQQMQEMMGPMMREMAFAPDHLLNRKDSLGLTADQVSRLTALRDPAKAAHDRAAGQAKAHMDALGKVFTAAAPDTAAARQHFQAAHQAMGDAHWAMLRAAAEARAVLTDGQRGRVEGWADAMQMMMQRRGPTGDPTHHPPHGPPR